MRKWFIKWAPERSTLSENRWLAPVASCIASPSVWHFDRRSIAKAVALGVFAGLILPIGQIILAVLLAASLRANILIASAATLVTNPLTFAPIYYAAYRTGSYLLALTGRPAGAANEGNAGVLNLLASLGAVSLPTLVGLIVLSVVSSFLAFAAVHLAWRGAVVWRWRRRRNAASESVPPDPR